MKDVKVMYKKTSRWSVFVNFWERYCGKSPNFKTFLKLEIIFEIIDAFRCSSTYCEGKFT